MSFCIIARREAALAAGQVPSLNRLPTSKIPPHKAIFFNEPKLSDLKQVFQKAGFQAEFNKGNLIINDLVAVKRVGCVINDCKIWSLINMPMLCVSTRCERVITPNVNKEVQSTIIKKSEIYDVYVMLIVPVFDVNLVYFW